MQRGPAPKAAAQGTTRPPRSPPDRTDTAGHCGPTETLPTSTTQPLPNCISQVRDRGDGCFRCKAPSITVSQARSARLSAVSPCTVRSELIRAFASPGRHFPHWGFRMPRAFVPWRAEAGRVVLQSHSGAATSSRASPSRPVPCTLPAGRALDAGICAYRDGCPAFTELRSRRPANAAEPRWCSSPSTNGRLGKGPVLHAAVPRTPPDSPWCPAAGSRNEHAWMMHACFLACRGTTNVSSSAPKRGYLAEPAARPHAVRVGRPLDNSGTAVDFRRASDCLFDASLGLAG